MTKHLVDMTTKLSILVNSVNIGAVKSITLVSMSRITIPESFIDLYVM